MVAFYGIYQSLSLGGSSLQPRTLSEMPKVSDGARLLTPFNGLQHLATAVYPKATVTPVFELGALTRDQERVVTSLNGGLLSCSEIEGLYDFILEDTLHGEPLACLRLKFTSGSIRLWQVVSSASSSENE